MSAADRRGRIAQLLREAAPADPTEPEAARPKSKTPTIALLVFIFCLIGSTLPHVNLNIFFSASAIISALIAFHTWWKTGRRLSLSNWKTPALAIALLTQVAGCAGMMMSDQPLDLVALGITSDKIKIGEASGIGVAGFGLQDVTLTTAMQNGNIQKPIGTQEARSFAVISMARVRVYGE